MSSPVTGPTPAPTPTPAPPTGSTGDAGDPADPPESADPPGPTELRFTVSQALALFAGSVALMIPVSGLVFAVGIAGVIAIQVLCIAGVPVVAARMHFGPNAWAALGFRRPPMRTIVGAICLGLGFWFVNLVLSAPFVEWLGGEEEIEQLGELVTGAPLWLAALALVAAPAVCEEILVRGVVARALDSAVGRAAAILISAALFSLLHFSLARLVPTAMFGVVLAWAALHTGSILPGIVMHALNNAVALVLTVELFAPLTTAMTEHPVWCLIGALLVSTVGAVLIKTADESRQ